MLGNDPHVRTIGQDWWPIIIVIIVHRNTHTNFKQQDLKFSKSPHAECRKNTVLCFSFSPGSWWILLLSTWTRSPNGKSRTAGPSTWRKSALSWPSWRRSDRPSSGRESRVRTGGASSAMTRRTTDVKLVAFPCLEAGQGVLFPRSLSDQLSKHFKWNLLKRPKHYRQNWPFISVFLPFCWQMSYILFMALQASVPRNTLAVQTSI